MDEKKLERPEELEDVKTQEDDLNDAKTWDDAEKTIAGALLRSNENFASAVIDQAKQEAKKNATSFKIAVFVWLVTFIALVATNAYWIHVFQSYEYYSQDGSGINSINTGDQEDITYESNAETEKEWQE